MHPDPTPEQIDAQFSQIVHQSYGGQLPPVPYVPPPRPRRPWGRWLALATAVLAAVCVGAGVGVVKVIDLLDQPGAGAGDPTPEPPVLAHVRKALEVQRDALLAGDEDGYLSVLDALVGLDDRTALSRQFRSLRAMRVADWRDHLGRITQNLSDELWVVRVSSSVCFVTAPCDDGRAMAETKWKFTGDSVTLAAWDTAEIPHPWQLSEVASLSGERTIVAAAKDHAGKLPTVLREAEKAALVADRFAWRAKPSRYVVYYAGKQEWSKWFGLRLADWTGAVAISISEDRYEVMLNGADMNADTMAGHLRHELTHASSLAGARDDSKRLWWLKEGLAELAESAGAPIRHHPGLRNASKVLDDSDDGFEVAQPTDESKDEAVSGAYAVAFLAVRCMSEREGEERLTQFFHAVVHEASSYEQASADVFGTDWAQISGECLSYVEAAVGTSGR